MKKLDYIDALRGLAILAVLMVHTKQFGNSNLPQMVNNILSQGSRGVQLFYVASAVTLFLSFNRRYDKEKFPIKNFLIRRFFRIAPMYYLGIIYYLFQEGLGPRYFLGDQPNITFLNVLSNFAFLHGFSPYWINSVVPGGWSIGVEMTFYALLPLLFFRIKNINQAFLLFIISILINTFLFIIFSKYPLISFNRLWLDYLFLYFPNQLPVFSIGIILYFVIFEKVEIKNLSGKLILAFTALIILQLSTGIQYLFPQHILFGFAFFMMAYGLSVYKLKIIVNTVIIYMGKVSYSMYLVHFAVLYWLKQLDLVDYTNNSILNYIIRLAVVLGISTLISTVTYRFIEVPFQNIGKKIIDKWEK